MIIESIKISNFLSHENTEINFEQGVNIITGKNGAGKTGILDAIKFALFAESRNNEKNNELIKKGKNFFEITLNFNISGDHYEVYRHFGVKKAKNAERLAYVKKNGVMTAETYEGVNSEITRVLNVSRDVFKNSVFVEQGQMDSLISGTPKERKTMFSDIIGLTSLSRSADRLREIIGNFRDETMLLQGSSDRLEQTTQDITKLEADKSSAFESLSIARTETEKYSRKLDELRVRQKERDGIQSLIQHLKSNISKYENEIATRENNAEQLKSSISKIKSTSDKVKKLQSNPYYISRDPINNYFLEKSGMDNALKDEQRAKSKLMEYEEYTKKLESLSEYHNNYSELHDKYMSNSEKIKEFRKTHETYLTIDSKLKSLSERLDRSKTFLENFMKSSGFTMDALINSRTRREEINREMREKTSRKSEIKSTVASYNQALKEARENMETLNGKNTCPLCGTELTPDHMKSILEEYGEKSKKILENIENLKSEKKSIEEDIEKLENEYKIFENTEIETAVSYIQEIKSMESDKATLEGELGNNLNGHKLFIELSNENDKLDKNMKVIQPYEDEYMRHKSIISGIDIGAIRKEIEDAELSISGYRKNMEKFVSEIGFLPEYDEYLKTGQISSEIDRLKIEVDRAREMEAHLESLEYEIEERQKSIVDIGKEVEVNERELQKYQGLDDQVNEMESLYRDANQKSIKMNTLVESYSERIAENKNIAKDLEQDAEKYKKLQKSISTLGKIRDAFDYNGIQAIIRKDASASMTNLTRKYLQSFNLDFDDISIDENFDIKVTQNSMEQTLESLSGGEKTALAIAIRLSVAEYVLDRISTIIMDEPTNFLDEDRRNNLKDIILYSLKGENLVPQMIMITHHSELISVADASYEIIKTGGISRVISS
ncbi:MAG: AAA family ATPase [Candidatus Thermoplasmatota archaeon]|nr:AAA family ATPase [Candidatus Thermoplasmatota archaeon]